MATTATGNVAKDAAEVVEVNNLLVKLGTLSAAAEQAERDQLRAAWVDGLADAAYLTRTARTLRARIGSLTTFSKRETGQASKVTEDRLPEGRYAIDGTEGATNETVFYVVKWWDGRNGRMFSMYSHVAGREDARLGYGAALSVAGRIFDQGVRESAIRYGHALGECSTCGRELTNDESRAAGIGPVCASKRGW